MPLIDTLVGEYRVLRLLGQGGMGEVYEATHPIIGKRVAVKVLRRELIEDSSLALRFIEEARAVNGIRHHSIVDVFGFGTLPNGQLYLVMDLLEGESFSDYLKANAPLEPQEAMRWLIELLDAIAAAHRAGVVHRDLKPSNLFLVGPRGKRTLKVLDFGIARRLKRDERLTHPNMLLGSPSYVSPEQIRGEAHFQSDLYAIGCMAWAMLTGRTLFKGEVLDVLNRHLFEVPAAPSSLVPGIAPELDAFVLKLLAKEPQDRPPSAAVARDELRVLAHAAKSSSTQVHYPSTETEEPGELADTRLHATPRALERTVVERRPATEAGPSSQRPAASTDTSPAVHEAQHPTVTAPHQRPTATHEMEQLVAPRSPLPLLAAVAAAVLLIVLGLSLGGPLSLSPVGERVGERAEPSAVPPSPPPKPEVASVEPPAPPVPPPARVEPEALAVTPRPPLPAKNPVAPPRKAPVAEPVARVKPAPPDELPSRDRAATAPSWSVLDARLKKDEAVLLSGHARGGANAAQFLADARERLSASPSAADRIALESFLDDWERRYLPVK